MANKFKAEVEVEIGGKVRLLRYDMNSLAELEQMLGKPVMLIFDEENLGVLTIRAALTAGLRGGGMSRVTQEQVGSWVDMSKIEYLSKKMGEALSLALGNEEDTEGTSGEVVDASPLELRAAPSG